MVQTIKMDDNTWRMEDGFVRFFLLAGNEKAVLIDSGVDCPNAKELAQELTDLPIMLINTHGDGDHTSGTAAFAEICMGEKDYTGCGVSERFPKTSLRAVQDGEIIDLGGRRLEIIAIPGHTAGSIAILDVERRRLFAGDSVQKGHIYMFGGKRVPESFENSLRKLIKRSDDYDEIVASHDEPVVPANQAEKVLAAWLKVRNGEIGSETIELFGSKAKSYSTPDCGFYL